MPRKPKKKPQTRCVETRGVETRDVAPATFELPAGWPAKGEYRGQPVDIVTAVRTLTAGQLAGVVVDVPGVGRHRPFRGNDVVIGADGKVYI